MKRCGALINIKPGSGGRGSICSLSNFSLEFHIISFPKNGPFLISYSDGRLPLSDKVINMLNNRFYCDNIDKI